MTTAANINRRKLLSAVLYFAKNTRDLNMTKLSKFLYFLDFNHLKSTGYPCIGLRYYAFKNGPLPREFWAEIKDGIIPEDFKGKFTVEIRPHAQKSDSQVKLIKALANPDLTVFTPREYSIMHRLVEIFADANAQDMSDVSHLKNDPWDVTWKTKGENCDIDYMLVVDGKSGVSADEARESLREYNETVRNFQLEATR